jgi:hypothetical protein
VIWGKDKENSGKLKGKKVSRSTNQLQNIGPRIRQTARKSIPIKFKKFSF